MILCVSLTLLYIIGENIQSVAELRRLPDDLIHLDDMSEKSVVYALTQVSFITLCIFY